jgi:hypothetical protein
MSTAAVPPVPPQPTSPRRSFWSRAWSVGQFVVALAATLGVLGYLLVMPASRPDVPSDDRQAAADEAVRLAGPGLIRVAPDTPLGRKLTEGATQVTSTWITAPVLTVTGTVVASLRPAAGRLNGITPAMLAVTGGLAATPASDYWQFNAPEVLTAYTDWQKARADIVFTRAQLVSIREAAVERTRAQRELVDTMVRLVNAGTETQKQLNIERSTLRQYEIQERKETHEADTAVKIAERTEAALARQLQQAGLDPALLTSVTSDVDIVMADVPETYLERVKAGQGCEARFFGIPGQVFAGQVKSIAPVISKERRSLRVLFTITDLNDQLRPGMFADIGLGTDPREALLAPADGVVHVGRSDYVLVGADAPDTWRVTEVRVGDARGTAVEILAGLKPGDRVVGKGAVLLKPFIVNAVQQTVTGVVQPGAHPAGGVK